MSKASKRPPQIKYYFSIFCHALVFRLKGEPGFYGWEYDGWHSYVVLPQPQYEARRVA